MQNIYFNPQQTYPYMQAHVFVACHTDLLFLTDIFFSLCRLSRRSICPSVCCHSAVLTDVSYSLPWPIQAKPSTRTFFYHRYSPHRLTCPRAFQLLSRPTQINLSTQLFYFHWHSSHTLIYTDVFQPLPGPTQANSFTHTFFFLFSLPQSHDD